MYSMLELDRPSSLLPLWTELTIPDVIVFRKENGLPMATTNSPCRTSDDRPRLSVGNGFWDGEREREREDFLTTQRSAAPQSPNPTDTDPSRGALPSSRPPLLSHSILGTPSRLVLPSALMRRHIATEDTRPTVLSDKELSPRL
ncbi:hypothetical protein EYF80_005564 [Liparis tanakae]|uniref:Uncharacterized protein n=1 Tax=Liparis tanakae TaxID=230148 RepID=A0A4Z2J2K2_9TELE|nr:hypothetical protein EYF80_005564 [Liparis tanakae]